MAQQVTASVYAMNNNLWGQSVEKSFPTQAVGFFQPPSGTVSYYGIHLYGAIKVFIEDGQPEYLTNKSFVMLATEANV